MASIPKVGVPKAPKPTAGKTPTLKQPKASTISGAGMKGYINASKLTPNPKPLKPSQITY